jgi:hypothetical protein
MRLDWTLKTISRRIFTWLAGFEYYFKKERKKKYCQAFLKMSQKIYNISGSWLPH